jgi:four helix bundle protein
MPVSERPKISSYKDLEVWQKAVTLAEMAYRNTSDFPRDELYGMSSQIRRSAVSIAANIAEGYGRDQTGNFIQFLRVAMGSAREFETHIIIAVRVKLLGQEATDQMANECNDISKMLRSLIRSLEAKKLSDT